MSAARFRPSAVAPALVAAAGLAVSAARAQPPAGGPPAGGPPTGAQPSAPPRFENLKVFPKNVSRDSLLTAMRGFTVALGVNCQYCHVAEPAPGGALGAPGGGPGGAPRERLRPALDDKPTKATARFMIRTAGSLNHVVLASLPRRHRPTVAVACVTCHRGSPLPQSP